MHRNTLQFFAGDDPGSVEGSASPGAIPADAGQDTGAHQSTADAGQSSREQPLELLGVPRDKAERHRARKRERTESGGPSSAAQEEAWERLLQDPAMNRKMQETVKARLRPVQSRLESWQPVIQRLGEHYGLSAQPRPEELLQAMERNGIRRRESEETGEADRTEAESQRERGTAFAPVQAEQPEAPGQPGLSDRQMAARYQQKLLRQAAALRQRFPGFELNRALTDPRFARMVSPRGGMSVEQAFYALNGPRIDALHQQQTARSVAHALGRSLRTGGSIPPENGSDGRSSPPPEPVPYSRMSREERAAVKASLYQGKLLHR